MPAPVPDRIRVDKWLWQARFFKSRTLAGEATSGLRVNGTIVSKPSHPVRPGDVLTFAKDRHIRLIRIEAIGTRRGPAAEAQALYTDLDPPAPRDPAAAAADAAPARPRGEGRPTKRDRREIDALRRGDP